MTRYLLIALALLLATAAKAQTGEMAEAIVGLWGSQVCTPSSESPDCVTIAILLATFADDEVGTNNCPPQFPHSVDLLMFVPTSVAYLCAPLRAWANNEYGLQAVQETVDAVVASYPDDTWERGHARVSRGVMLPSTPFFITIFEPRVYGMSSRLMVLSWWAGE